MIAYSTLSSPNPSKDNAYPPEAVSRPSPFFDSKTEEAPA